MVHPSRSTSRRTSSKENEMTSSLEQAIALTEKFLAISPDPAMKEVHAQLLLLRNGHQANTSIGRIVTYNYTPAPNAELQDWADLVLKAWSESKGN